MTLRDAVRKAILVLEAASEGDPGALLSLAASRLPHRERPVLRAGGDPGRLVLYWLTSVVGVVGVEPWELSEEQWRQILRVAETLGALDIDFALPVVEEVTNER